MTRILFVDDEPCVLDGIRRMLRTLRTDWRTGFVTSGALALEELAREPADIVVADMRMPEMDGPELLTRVRSDFPEAIRIVLSGYADVEATMRAVPVAHQFLSKPCDGELLHQTLLRACGLRERLRNQTTRRLLGKVRSLPTLPRIYRELSTLLADTDVALPDVARLVQSDPAISAKILQLVNSSFFGLARPLSAIKDAVTYLGTARLKNLVLSASVLREFTGVDSDRLERERIDAEAVAVVASTMVAGTSFVDDAYIAGMLHDVGRLVLLDRFDGKKKSDGASADPPPTAEERRAFEAVHAEVGAYLLGLWGLPIVVVDAVAAHHAAPEADAAMFDVASVIQLAVRLVARARPFDPEAPGGVSPACDDVLDRPEYSDRIAGWSTKTAEVVADVARRSP